MVAETSSRGPQDTGRPEALAFIGFGEAARAFVTGWADGRPAAISAFDIKTLSPDASVADAKRADYASHRVAGGETVAEALAGAQMVISVVTADQALVAARSACGHIAAGAFYLDCNSCAPNTKREAAGLIEAAGGRYVDVAVMAPVHPRLHHVPLRLSGPHAETVKPLLDALDMKAAITPGDVGASSSIKMIRSIMIKGMEALTAECILSARKAGVEEAVLASLDASFPGFDWKAKAAYNLERVMTHGIRRAAEMREVALTVDDLGLSGDMARAAVEWQQRIGDLKLDTSKKGGIGEDYAARADAILDCLEATEKGEEPGK